MKILYLNYSPSLVQFTRTYGLADGLRNRGHEVIVRNMHHSIPSQLKARKDKGAHSSPAAAAPLSASPKRLPRPLRMTVGEIRRFIGNIRYIAMELALISKHKPDLVIVRPVTNWSIYLTAFILRQKWMMDTDGPLLEIFQYQDDPILPRYYLKNERFFVRRVKSVLTISTAMKKYYADCGGDPDRIFICPNAVDPVKFRYDVDPSEVIGKYGLEGKTVVGFMGNLAPWHGLPGLLNIFPKMAAKYENVRLLLVGIELDWKNLPDVVDRELLQCRDQVICTGRVPFEMMPGYLKAIDIFVLPYPRIDFFYFSPIKLFESMAVGCAVVGADLGQVGEVISDGEDGVLFPGGDYEALGRKIEELIGNPKMRSRMGKAAAEKVRSNYTWEHVTGAVIEAYNYTYGN